MMVRLWRERSARTQALLSAHRLLRVDSGQRLRRADQSVRVRSVHEHTTRLFAVATAVTTAALCVAAVRTDTEPGLYLQHIPGDCTQHTTYNMQRTTRSI